jgi:hypothetical protein
MLQPLTIADQLVAKEVLLELISDQDSFVYLNVIHAIGRLIDLNRKALFPSFLRIFESPEALGKDERLCVRDRAALAEALSFAIRRAGEAAPIYVPEVVRICVKLCSERVVLFDSSGQIDLDGRKLVSKVDPQDDATENESSSNTSIRVEEMAMNADMVYLRQSAFSLLAEAVSVAG